MLIYLSGPMTGYPDFNYPAFEATAARLRASGLEVVNPTQVGWHTDWSWERYLGAAIALQVPCDATYMLPNWRQSRGARLEYEVAVALGHRLYGYLVEKTQASPADGDTQAAEIPPQTMQGEQ